MSTRDFEASETKVRGMAVGKARAGDTASVKKKRYGTGVEEWVGGN